MEISYAEHIEERRPEYASQDERQQKDGFPGDNQRRDRQSSLSREARVIRRQWRRRDDSSCASGYDLILGARVARRMAPFSARLGRKLPID